MKNISREKGGLKKIRRFASELRPVHKYFSGIWANQRLNKITSIRFSRALFISSNFAFRPSSHICIGINSEITFSSKLWK